MHGFLAYMTYKFRMSYLLMCAVKEKQYCYQIVHKL